MDANSESTGFLVIDLARLFRQHFDAAIAREGLGITAGEARVLFYAAAADGMRQSVLADRMRIEPMTVSNFVDRLEERRLVRREADPADRRAKLVRVTAAAKPLLVRIEAVAARVRDQATSGLAPSEVAAMRRALQLMRANLAGAGEEERAA